MLKCRGDGSRGGVAVGAPAAEIKLYACLGGQNISLFAVQSTFKVSCALSGPQLQLIMQACVLVCAWQFVFSGYTI